ncbi:MAG: sensor domain-containing diguanylate cyclase [Pyrinomonadaceae bacterium]
MQISASESNVEMTFAEHSTKNLMDAENHTKNEKNVLDELADDYALAVVIVDENSSVVSESNNNSMCRALYTSKSFAPLCAEFCGKAFAWANKSESAVEYECYAGLKCSAVRIESSEKPLVAIVGRTFLKAENYRKATGRAISGDWQKFPPSRFFENVLLTGSDKKIEKLTRKIANLSEEVDRMIIVLDEKNPIEIPFKIKRASEKQEDTLQLEDLIKQFEENKTAETPMEIAEIETTIQPDEAKLWRSFFGSLLEMKYRRALSSILDFVSTRYALSSLAWLERKNNHLEVVSTLGELKNEQFQISLPADDRRVIEAFRRETSLELRAKNPSDEAGKRRTIQLFPIAVGEEVRAALVVANEITDENKKHHISKFCRSIATELEILRLRDEIEKRSFMMNAVQKLNASMTEIDAEDFWTRLLQIAVELMQAERGSILVYDEKENLLTTKSAVGLRADFIKLETETLGEKVSLPVLQNGKPLLATNFQMVGITPAPAEYQYKSASFICYPMNVGGRKIGVLNIADKTDGNAYSEFDLELLHSIIPQFAVLIDRAVLKNKAGEFQQLSVTDALTGLLNRRYIEERLTEETNRSNRYGYPMSLMMIDVDSFKSYNDTFGHPEGDRALQIVSHTLKDTLRCADVAARYGGEEFSILLPQTTSEEARTIAERIRQKIEATQFPHRKVTVSIGIASCSRIICTPPEIIKAADQALYEAKRKGRNNVQIYEKFISVE